VLLKGNNKHYDDRKQYVKETFVDRINELNFIIRQFQKLHDKAPATDNVFRAKVLKEIQHTKRILSKIQVEYDIFKKYKTRTPISK
jgi:hypothetical protein